MLAAALTTIFFSLSVVFGARSARLLGPQLANLCRMTLATVLLAPLTRLALRCLAAVRRLRARPAQSLVVPPVSRRLAMCVGGLSLSRLAERVGQTPFYAYDRALLAARVAAVRAAIEAGYTTPDGKAAAVFVCKASGGARAVE